MEYVDGVLVERIGGDEAHALLQVALAAYLHARRKQWNIQVYLGLRTRVLATRYRIADISVYPCPGFEGRYPTVPPLLWIEILSPDDRVTEVWKKTRELVANGAPYIWIIEPESLASELWTPTGIQTIADKTLRLPNFPIVIPLLDVMEE
jgi:Uma2 family endonuclease